MLECLGLTKLPGGDADGLPDVAIRDAIADEIQGNGLLLLGRQQVRLWVSVDRLSAMGLQTARVDERGRLIHWPAPSH